MLAARPEALRLVFFGQYNYLRAILFELRLSFADLQSTISPRRPMDEEARPGRMESQRAALGVFEAYLDGRDFRLVSTE